MSLMGRTRRRRSDADGDERELISGLRAGKDSAFMALMDMYGAMLLRLALMYVPSRAVAEDVVQDTWIGILKGIDRFEGRSSLKTWIFRILVNNAKTRGQREGRSIPFSSAAGSDPDAPSVDPDRFFPDGHPQADGWALGPTPWPSPEQSLLAGEERDVILRAIEALPPAQREVITMRDLEGWTSDEVCNALDVSQTNQRVLLHRARSKVRAALERQLGTMRPTD